MSLPDHEHFGQLRFRKEEGWGGWIHLRRFAECRDAAFDANLDAVEQDESFAGAREKKRHERRKQELAESRFQLLILDPEEEGVTAAQQRAFDFLIEHESEVLDAVLQSVLEDYCHRGYWTLDGYMQDSFGPSGETVDDVKNCLRLESVMIDHEETDASAPVTFRFSSSLDEEHGIEITTEGAQVESPYGDRLDPFSGQTLLRYPFDLPDSIDASAIPASSGGHRFVELQYGGRWSGVFVLDSGMQCVGVVVNSRPRPLFEPKDIQGVRALTPLRRWRASLRVQRIVLSGIGIVNCLVTLPCLIIAWMYEPRLFWACVVLGLMAHVGCYLMKCWSDHLFGLATWHIVLSIAGLIYASRAHDFGGEAHAEAVSSLFGLILWWGTCGITFIAAAILAVAIVTVGPESRRDGLGTFLFLTPGVLCVAALTLGLTVTSTGHWSTLHLLWMTPGALLGSLVVFFGTVFFMPTNASKEPPCPHCGKPLASSKAQQCLHCGEDWHDKPTDDQSNLAARDG
jgi:hypothetical protein